MSVNANKLNWETFAYINNDKRTAFENMCRLIFWHHFCDEHTILHSNSNNPGIETEPVFSTKENAKIGFQTKYFDNSVNYSQIKDSAEKTIQYYRGKIDKFILFCNQNITTNSNQYLEIFNLLNNANIEILPISNQSIFDLLTKYSGIASLYFGCLDFSSEWFKKLVENSLDELGDRYNKDFNVETKTQELLDLFLLNSKSLEYINSKKNSMLEEIIKIKDKDRQHFLIELYNYVKKIPDINYLNYKDCLNWEQIFRKTFQNEFDSINQELEVIKTNVVRSNYDRLINLSKIVSLNNYLQFSFYEQSCINNNILILKGEAGMGKTQLLATIANDYVNHSKPVFLFLGHKFYNYQNIEQAILNMIELKNNSIDDVFDAINELAFINQQPCLIIIDAINENNDNIFWRNNLTHFINKIKNYSNIRLIISFRSDYEELLLDDNIKELIKNNSISSLNHTGFIDINFKAINSFLNKYGITFEPEYYLQDNMYNPLYLTWFCQVYKNNNKLSFYELMDKILLKIDEDAKKYLSQGFESFNIITELIKEVCQHFLDNKSKQIEEIELLNLPVWNNYGLQANKITYINALTKSSFFIHYIIEDRKIYKFTFNLLEDYCLANYITNKYKTIVDLNNFISQDLLNIVNNTICNQSNIPLSCMVYAIFADKNHEIDLSSIEKLEKQDKIFFTSAYIKTYKYRKVIVLNEFIDFVGKFRPKKEDLWNLLLETATNISSPLNANYLHDLLLQKKLHIRDYLWTTFINGLNEDYRIYNLIINIKNNEFKLNNSQQTQLFLELLTWFLTSSNRLLRDNASIAMIELLKDNFYFCKKLIEKFKTVNDPYVLQRLYGIVFGTCLKRKNMDESCYRDLVLSIYNNIFKQSIIYEDVLLRDYARLIIERYIYEFPKNVSQLGINTNTIRPLYKSTPLPSKQNIKQIVIPKGDSEFGTKSIIYSMAFESTPGLTYGDFGRYVFQSSLEEFKIIDIDLIHDYALDYIFNTLGYDENLFGEYDTNLNKPIDRYEHNVERIGKKYQWIAFYNIMARVADYYKLDCIYDNMTNKTYQGSWQPFVRDFDPTKNIIIKKNDKLLGSFQSYCISPNIFIEKKSSDDEINNWIEKPIDISNIFNDYLNKAFCGNNWLVLSSNLRLVNKSKMGFDSISNHRGGQAVELSVNSLIVTKSNLEKLKSVLSDNRFINNKMNYRLFNREFIWSPAFNDANLNEDSFQELESIMAFPTVQVFRWETEYDASQEGIIEFLIPSNELISKLELIQQEKDGYYCINNGDVVAFDLLLEGNQSSKFIFKKDVLDEYLKSNDMVLVWQIFTRKVFYTGENSSICALCDWQGYCEYQYDKVDVKLTKKQSNKIEKKKENSEDNETSNFLLSKLIQELDKESKCFRKTNNNIN